MQNSGISLLWLVAANLDLSSDVTHRGPEYPGVRKKNGHISPVSGTYTNGTLSCESGKYC